MTKKSLSGAKTRQLSMRMSDEIYDYVKEISDAERRSMAYIIEGILKEWIDRKRAKHKSKGDDSEGN